MCYPAASPPPSPEVEVSKKRWATGLFSTPKVVKALREMKLNKTIRNNGREIRQHIRSVRGNVTNKARRVRRHAFRFTFSILCVNLIWLGFMMLLHPQREIQIGITAAVLVFFFVFFISTNEDQNEEKKLSEEVFDTEDLLLPSQSLPFQLYSLLPLNLISQLWGMLADIELPQPFNTFSVWIFATVTGCKRDEAEFGNLSHYKTISQFFIRKLTPGLRPICADSDLVSPADGTVTYSGLVEGRYLQQVKGVQYDLNVFLGGLDNIMQHKKMFSEEQDDSLKEIEENEFHISAHSNLLISQSGSPTRLYQTVVYLSPSDYHRFHSPASWTLTKRRHFPGKLYSVAPSLVRRIPGLFHTNERVAFLGRWDYGFFAMVAVGATNVGSIKVHFDEALSTNTNTSSKGVTEKIYEAPIQFEKGDEFGFFNFGSTIVLIYEAPVGITFNYQHMGRVKMGERMWM